MRLCDEYASRIRLSPLRLRHTSSFFLFFNSGERLLSVKWLRSSDSSGRYEFLECVLGSLVRVEMKKSVEWSLYESTLISWLDKHEGLVFGKDEVFGLVWNFFVMREDLFLSRNYSPMRIHKTISDYESAFSLLKDQKCNSIFWRGVFGDILRNYAYWLE